jgi:hypothetical protein
MVNSTMINNIIKNIKNIKNLIIELNRQEKTLVSLGSLHIPLDRIPAGKHLKFINYNKYEIDRIRTLGYELVSVKDPVFKDLIGFLSGGPLNLSKKKHVLYKRRGQTLGLVWCPKELKLQHEVEKELMIDLSTNAYAKDIVINNGK